MQQEYEIIGYSKMPHIHIFIDEVRYRTPHIHAEYEFCFALKGSGVFRGLGKEISVNEGEILFFDSADAHAIETGEASLTGLFVQISNRFLAEYVPELHGKSYQSINFKDVLGLSETKGLFALAIKTARSYFAEEEGFRLQAVEFALTCMKLVLNHVPQKSLNPKDARVKDQNAMRLMRIMDYIDGHLDDKISLQEIADAEGISVFHLSHLLSSHLGVSFQDYVNDRRLEKAVFLMSFPSKRITEIAYEAGFSDPKYMTKIFRKRFQCTPNEFRKKNLTLSSSYSKGNPMILERIFLEEEALEWLATFESERSF